MSIKIVRFHSFLIKAMEVTRLQKSIKEKIWSRMRDTHSTHGSSSKVSVEYGCVCEGHNKIHNIIYQKKEFIPCVYEREWFMGKVFEVDEDVNVTFMTNS